MTIAALYRSFSKVDLEKASATAIDATAHIAEDLNRAQLDKGEYANGGYLPDYSPVSVMMFGKRPGPWRLFDTGDFWKELRAMEQGFNMSITSFDAKLPLIMAKKKITGEVFGLTDENKTVYLKDVQTEFITEIQKQMK